MTKHSMGGWVLVGLTAMLAGSVQAQSDHEDVQSRSLLSRATEYHATTCSAFPFRPATTSPRALSCWSAVVSSMAPVASRAPPTLVVEGKTITAMLPAGATGWPKDAKVYDVTGKTVDARTDRLAHASDLRRGIRSSRAAVRRKA